MKLARANNLNKVVFSKEGAKIGLVSVGKSWLDTVHALDLLGINEQKAKELGIRRLKLA